MGYHEFNDDSSGEIPPPRCSEYGGEDGPSCWGGGVVVVTHGVGLVGGGYMAYKGVSKVDPGYHQVLYLHESDI